jgi:hypothetical protein
MLIKKILIFGIILFGTTALSGCGLIDTATQNISSVVGLNQTGTVISKRANIRSSYAVVAADLLEVKRGEQLEVLDETTFEKVSWYRVRANDDDQTEGWIEAQHIIIEESLDKSKKLAEEEANRQPQATGQLRAASNLRLDPQVAEDNILLRLDNGATFQIIDWKFVAKSEEDIEKEPENEDIKAAKEDDKDEPKKLDDIYDIWYKVRLDPSISPAPMGWVFGRQVELQVPSDIVYYQTNDRKFITWQRLDDAGDDDNLSKDTGAKISKPGSWVVLSRTDEVKAIDGVEPDFDGILVLGFDKVNQEHYTAYSTRRERFQVWGRLPLTVEGTGDNRTFSLRIRNPQSGEVEEKRFVTFKDKNGRLRVTPPEGLKEENDDKKKK